MHNPKLKAGCSVCKVSMVGSVFAKEGVHLCPECGRPMVVHRHQSFVLLPQADYFAMQRKVRRAAQSSPRMKSKVRVTEITLAAVS